jgi:hypothetical protein
LPTNAASDPISGSVPTLATGFDAHAYVRPLAIVGEAGVSLDEAWVDGPMGIRLGRGARLPKPVHVDGPAFTDRQPVAGDHRRASGRLRDVVDQSDPR